jgi:PIN domain nuclease of toxin-antitoxin system
MKLLLDTHILLWGAVEPERLPKSASSLIESPDNEIMFSALSLWEIAIKTGRGRADFRVDVGILRRSLFDNGYAELPVTGAHAAALASLPPIHKDPFDRMLVAQAMIEGLTLVTADPRIAKYPGPIRLV